MQAETAPLLFFDSGVGGLSILAPTRRILPQAPIVYAADSAFYPYGTKSEAEISARVPRSEEHTSELQSLMRNSYAVFCLKKQISKNNSISQKSKQNIKTSSNHTVTYT